MTFDLDDISVHNEFHFILITRFENCAITRGIADSAQSLLCVLSQKASHSQQHWARLFFRQLGRFSRVSTSKGFPSRPAYKIQARMQDIEKEGY